VHFVRAEALSSCHENHMIKTGGALLYGRQPVQGSGFISAPLDPVVHRYQRAGLPLISGSLTNG